MEDFVGAKFHYMHTLVVAASTFALGIQCFSSQQYYLCYVHTGITDILYA